MKLFCTLLCSFILSASLAQTGKVNFDRIDYEVSGMDAPTPELLAAQFSKKYNSELEKTRAIFSWIAQHISYNTGYLRPTAARYFEESPEPDSIWKSGNEMTARKVMRRRMAVCDGYAKLFQTLCSYAGLQSELINGYARGTMDRSNKFRTNHTWNSVRIDSVWYLVDVTWGAGYMDWTDKYVSHLNESYFLAVPRQFIIDHYPEDLHWTLMEDPPVLSEFRHNPFRYKSFVKYGFTSYAPLDGRIEVNAGDTIQIEMQVKDAVKNKRISSDPFFDTTFFSAQPNAVFLQPELHGNSVSYRYVNSGEAVEWIFLIYNDDVILRYHVSIKGFVKEAGEQ